jgi:hypothetical protein
MQSTIQSDFVPEFDAETSASSSTLDQMDQHQSEACEARSAYKAKSIAVSEDYMLEPEFDDASLELRPSGLEHVSEPDELKEDQVCQTLEPAAIHSVCSDEAREPQLTEAILYYKFDLADHKIVNDVFGLDSYSNDENSCETAHDVPGFDLDSRCDDENPHETVYECFDLDSYFGDGTDSELGDDYDPDWESYIAKSKGTDLPHSIEVQVDCLMLPSDDGKACEIIHNVLNSHSYSDNEKTHEKHTNIADPDLCIQDEDPCGSIYDVFSLKSYLDDEAPCKTAFDVFDSFACFDEESIGKAACDNFDADLHFNFLRCTASTLTTPDLKLKELRPDGLNLGWMNCETKVHKVLLNDLEALIAEECSSSAKSPVESSEGRRQNASPEATHNLSGISDWFLEYESDEGEVPNHDKTLVSMHESGEGYEDPPKKDPDKVVGYESNSNRGKAPEYVRPLPITPEFEDGYGDPPTKDPDKGANTIKYSGDGLARGYESKVTPGVESIRNVELHSDILALDMPEGTYIICGDEIALFEAKRESEPSRKSNIARALNLAQEGSQHEHKELRPPGLNDELNFCCPTLCTEFRGEVSTLKTPEGIYIVHSDLVILFEAAQDPEREIQFRGELSLAQDGAELKAKELRPLSLSDVFGISEVDAYAWDSGYQSDIGLGELPEGIGLIDLPEVILTRELNHEEWGCDLIGKHTIIHGGIDAVKSPTFENAVNASPGIRAPKHAKAPCFPGDGYECRPEKDPDKVSNANECPGDGLAREQESEETPEVKCLRGVESHGDTRILAMPDSILSTQAAVDLESKLKELRPPGLNSEFNHGHPTTWFIPLEMRDGTYDVQDMRACRPRHRHSSCSMQVRVQMCSGQLKTKELKPPWQC